MKSISLILLLFIPILNFGQYRFDYLDIENGLTENSVTEIFHDSEGYMWFSTQDGISQYDGDYFKNYNITSRDSFSLTDNYLWGFAEDSLGFIWVCSRNGLNRIDKKTGKIIQFYRNNSGINGANQAIDITIFKGNVFAIINNQIYKISVKSHYPDRVNLINNKIDLDSALMSSFHVDFIQDELYIVQGNGIYNYSKGELHNISKFQEELVLNFLKTDQKGETIWFTNGLNLYSFDIKTKKIKSFNYDFNGAIIYDLMVHKEELWVATDKGVYVIKGGQIEYHLIKNKEFGSGLSSNFISALGKDKTGKIWLGTAGNGLNIYNPKQDKFKYLSKEVFGNEYIVRSVVQTKNNQLLVCSSSHVFVVELKTSKLTTTNFVSDNVTSVKKLKLKNYDNIVPTKVALGNNGDVLIGTKKNGIIVLDKDLQVKTTILLNDNRKEINLVSDIILTRQNQFWVTTYYGVFHLDKNYTLVDSFFPHKNGLNTGYFLSVFEDTENQIWMGSNNGIYRYLGKSKMFKHYPYLKNNQIESPGFNFVCGFVDFGDGYLWMATYGGGLSKMDKKKETFIHFRVEDGLSNNVCNGLLSDNKDNLWINTNRGLNKFDPVSEQFINYSKSDGLHFNEFNLNSFYKNEFNELLFGTPIGLVVFNPDDIEISKNNPSILIRAIDINYKDERLRLVNNQLELFQKDKVIIIHFVGLNYSNSEKISYKYKLEGYDDDWVVTKELKAKYTSLPEGNFTFLVDVTNEDGVWNQTPKSIKIIVHPPIYKTWWFITSIALLFLVIISFIIRYFAQRNIKKRLRELRIKQEIQHEKQRISRDLHDNIGAQITYLISSIDQEAYAVKEYQDVFDLLSDKARNVMTQLRQTIWLISKEAINVTEFAEKVRDYSTKILSAANINSIVEVDGNKYANLPPTVVSHLFRIIQEAQNNIIKHSEATEVKIEFIAGKNTLQLIIKDNGIGIGEIATLDDHFGLKNMKDRAAELKGKLKIEKQSGDAGTQIIVEIPLKN